MIMKEITEIQNDDSWWASVLADENDHVAEAPSSLAERPEKEKFPFDWAKAQHLFDSDGLVFLEVTEHNQGGLLVEGENLKGFVPYSHLNSWDNEDDASKREETLIAYHGESLKLKIIECVPEKRRIILSERAAQAGEGSCQELFASLKSGDSVEGEVSNITDFGVFIELGGVEGLIHVSELSWGRVEDPREVVKIHEKLKVQVLHISPERRRIALSLKRLVDNPWEKLHEKYEIKKSIPAKITSVVSFGAFACLEKGVEGLIHSSEVPPSKGHLLRKGETLDVQILHIEAEKQRLSLTLNFEGNHG
jgi:small subunit ribosomal protein S1